MQYTFSFIKGKKKGVWRQLCECLSEPCLQSILLWWYEGWVSWTMYHAGLEPRYSWFQSPKQLALQEWATISQRDLHFQINYRIGCFICSPYPWWTPAMHGSLGFGNIPKHTVWKCSGYIYTCMECAPSVKPWLARSVPCNLTYARAEYAT
jgi:hypothetical protein